MQCISPYLAIKKCNGRRMYVPCGQCMPCKVNRKREWTIRMEHELRYHDNSAFVTLTYDNARIMELNLSVRDVQLFIKRLRKYYNYHYRLSLRYYACGEYGSQTMRPHYHGIFYGLNPDHGDLVRECWDLGHTAVYPVRQGGCGYVAKYVTKTDSRQLPPGRRKPFSLFSKGLGRKFADQYKSYINDVESPNFGMIYHKSGLKPVPKYYKNRCYGFPQKAMVAQTQIHELDKWSFSFYNRFPKVFGVVDIDRFFQDPQVVDWLSRREIATAAFKSKIIESLSICQNIEAQEKLKESAI